MCVGSSNLLFGQKILPTSVVECQFGTKSLSCALNKRDDFVGLKSDTVNVNSRLAPLRRVFTEICESWFNRLVLKTSDHKRSIRSNRIVSASSKMITWHCPQNNLTKFTKCAILNSPQPSMAKVTKYLLSML